MVRARSCAAAADRIHRGRGRPCARRISNACRSNVKMLGRVAGCGGICALLRRHSACLSVGHGRAAQDRSRPLSLAFLLWRPGARCAASGCLPSNCRRADDAADFARKLVHCRRQVRQRQTAVWQWIGLLRGARSQGRTAPLRQPCRTCAAPCPPWTKSRLMPQYIVKLTRQSHAWRDILGVSVAVMSMEEALALSGTAHREAVSSCRLPSSMPTMPTSPDKTRS